MWAAAGASPGADRPARGPRARRAARRARHTRHTRHTRAARRARAHERAQPAGTQVSTRQYK